MLLKTLVNKGFFYNLTPRSQRKFASRKNRNSDLKKPGSR